MYNDNCNAKIINW